ncbi:MAG TPA: hypothetical protein PLP19_10805 [bacterium]|nr:hypothetical protein [bacterium]HPN43969.1 hypothetical protein [bacterium]
MDKAIKIFKSHAGYAFLKDLKEQGIHTDTLRKLVNESIVEKIKPGLYKLTDAPVYSQQGFIDVCLAMPRAVICLFSALDYYELTTFIPSMIMVAIPRDQKPQKIIYPPVDTYYFSNNMYQLGIEKVKTDGGWFNIYSKEKTIIDCFRYRNKLGEDIAVEGLKNYLKGNFKMNSLIGYAQKSRMYNVVKPYITAIVNE